MLVLTGGNMFGMRRGYLFAILSIVLYAVAEEASDPDADWSAGANATGCGCGCNLVLTSSSDSWRPEQVPADDCLDEFIVYKTGCTYRALQLSTTFSTPRRVDYYEGLFEWRGAVRAHSGAVIRVLWGDGSGTPYTGGYTFYIGDGNNTVTSLNLWSPWTRLEQRSTPGILAADRYVPFYIRLQAGTLSFGKQCESAPLFSHPVTIDHGQEVRLQFQPYSSLGGKFLHCPQDLVPPVSLPLE